MRIDHLSIENFRGLESISVDLDRECSVIVGPNAIGKTTILEAVRLLKSVLSPRYGQEPQQTLQALGALSPHHQFLGPKGFDYANLARDVEKPLVISAEVSFSKAEKEALSSAVPAIALSVLQSQTGRGDDASSQLLFTQYLSSSDGQSNLRRISGEVQSALAGLTSATRPRLELTVTGQTNTFSGNNIYLQQAIAHLERILPPDVSKVSYFPADRALPQGEITIQLGSQNAQAEVQAHLSQAHTRYGRLKNSIAQDVVSGKVPRKDLEDDFRSIFDVLLPGKVFKEIVVNQLGILKVMVEDKATGKTFDIDSMSSGEKGLILTFLFLKRTIAEGGILLLDEPESHLNPSVTRKLLKYLIGECCKPKSIQSLLCTHSPEIVADAYGSDDCRLFHLRSGTDLSPIYRQDTSELFEVFERLGSTAAEVLFSSGSIFVEGEHDAEILREGFDDVVGGYAMTQLGGRAEVEKASRELKRASERADINKIKLFILDNDGKPFSETSEGTIRIIQWDRYCLENYLLEDTPIYEVTKEYSQSKPASRGEFERFMHSAALKQIDLAVAKEIYAGLEPENPGLIPKELKGKNIPEIAAILSARLIRIQGQMQHFDGAAWERSFIAAAEQRQEALTKEWSNDWLAKADGKKIIDALFAEYRISLDKATFKKKVIRAMQINKGRVYRRMRERLSKALTE